MRTKEDCILAVAARIPRGRVATYGQRAFLAGLPGRARLAGRAMAHAPPERNIPCHRVVNHRGRLAPGYPQQRGLLEASHAH